MLVLVLLQSAQCLLRVVLKFAHLLVIPAGLLQSSERVHKPALAQRGDAVPGVQFFPFGAVQHAMRIAENSPPDKRRFSTTASFGCCVVESREQFQFSGGVVKKLVACLLLALSVTCTVPAYAKAHLNPEARAAQKRAKKQQKAMRKNAKAQQKAQRKAQLEEIRRARPGR